MSEETNSVDPADLQLPRDYEEDLDYRQPKPIISSTDTSEDEDKNRSGETTPINNTIPDNPIPPNPFALLNNLVDMANQGTGGNAQQIGDGTNSIPLAPNIADVADQLADLTINSQKQVILHLMTLSKSTKNWKSSTIEIRSTMAKSSVQFLTLLKL
jgi:hypothetical protein